MEVPFLVAAAQRRSVRRFVRMQCEVVRERGFTLLGKHAVDLSTSGMRVAALDDVLTGEPVILTFRAPGTEAWIDAEGTVSRIVQGRRALDFGPYVAVEFKGLCDNLRSILRRQLLRCPPTLPKRAPRIDYAATIARIAASPIRPALAL
jgi:hypothetical protein